MNKMSPATVFAESSGARAAKRKARVDQAGSNLENARAFRTGPMAGAMR